MTAPAAALFAEHGRALWQLLYRLTGSAADADDLVQETFARALERPPADTTLPWRPWLFRVAVNLGRDALRKRRRRGYEGPWLPEPVEGDEALVVPEPAGAEGRYELLESASFAFLVALEALTQSQRAVLLLRDVFAYSAAEVAEALGTTEGAVRVAHLRARRKLEAYDRRRAPRAALAEAQRVALERFMAALASGDPAEVEKTLADDARAITDGGGVFLAARLPVVGAKRVAAFMVGIARKGGMPARAAVVTLNGQPALVAEFGDHGPRLAPRAVFRVEVGEDGRIVELHTVLPDAKLGKVRALAQN